MTLEGRVALITGAGSGLGAATAELFSSLGARVVVNDLNEAAARDRAEALPGPGRGVGGDVSRPGDVEAFVARAVEAFGRIDILVNNAGIPDTVTPTVEQSFEHWKKLIDVHLSGTYLVSKAVAVGMIEQRSGVILNLNSIAGVLGLPKRTAYSAAKAGIGMLTRTLGCEWAPHGIRVNAVAPGYIRTPMTDALIAEGRIDLDRINRRTPMGRMGSAEDIARALAFLASDAASFITGVTLPVDGGYCAFGAPMDAHPGA